jgi:outer membrane protein insertion porin family
VVQDGDSTIVRGDHYIPFAGFARLSTSVEYQFPLPFSESDHQSFVFVDGGRVWNADARYGAGGPDPLKQERFFWSTGVGTLFQTPAGPLRIALAYKLNPSVLDLRDARDVTSALLAGQAIESVPARNARRFHLHLSIGQGF